MKLIVRNELNQPLYDFAFFKAETEPIGQKRIYNNTLLIYY